MTSGVGAITGIVAWEALDSRGNPTVGCRVDVAGGRWGRAVVPSGASAGRHEAFERRDGGSRYAGKGVRAAVAAVNGELRGRLLGQDATDQSAVDATLHEIDPTPGFGRVGANATLAVSLATASAAAAARGLELFAHVAGDRPPVLPMPMVNVISGGAHAARAVDVQDFLVIPVGAASFAEAIEWCGRVRRSTAAVLADRGGPAALVADEGGLAAPGGGNSAALALLVEGIDRSGLQPGEQVAIAIDVAATQLVDGDGYDLPSDGRRVDAGQLVDLLVEWRATAPVVSIEDPLGEDDWSGWADATRRLGGIQVLGDDLFVTDVGRLRRGVEAEVANAVLVKPNQTGTLSDAARVVDLALRSGYAPVVSARSGDTEDDWLADVAVGWAAGQIKVGSTMRSERTAKWNRLLELEARHGLPFAGRGVIAGSQANTAGRLSAAGTAAG